MNQECNKDKVMGGALGIVGGTSIAGGVAFGAHMGIRSDAAFNWAANNKDSMAGKGILKYNEKVSQAKDDILKNKGSSNSNPNIIDAEYSVSDEIPNKPIDKYNSNKTTSGEKHNLPEASTDTILYENEAMINKMNKKDSRTERMNEARKKSEKQNRMVDAEIHQKQLDNMRAKNVMNNGDANANKTSRMNKTIEKTIGSKKFIEEGRQLRDIGGNTMLVDAALDTNGKLNYAEDSQRAFAKHSRRIGSSTVGRSKKGITQAGKKAVQTVMKLT